MVNNSRQAKIICSVPHCGKPVGYHKIKTNKAFGNIKPAWKSVCEKHRHGIGKDLVDRWKLNTGCENSDGRYGLRCTSVISDPGQLQINHKDGNNLNRDESNIEILCGNCHIIATRQNKHHLPRTTTRQTKIGNPKLFDGI